MKKMRPLKLKIAGLNSFVEEQIIDFEVLTEKGLFGIFGPTGSGKSTIIDAITLSMYGKIPRNSKDFINTQSTSMSLTYQFEIGVDGARKRYIVERNVKRDAKSGGYKTTLARLREIGESGERVLAEKDREVQQKIVDLIGLTAEDFTRSVVLPQGKFSEFLKLTGKERRDMLERIFGLEKYGSKLLVRIRDVKREKSNLLNEVNAKLSQHEGVTKEALEDLKKKFEILKEEEKTLKEQKDKLDKEREKLKGIWEKQQELNQFLHKKEILDQQLKEIEDKKEKLKKAEKALSVKPYIDSLVETEKKLILNQKDVEKYSKELEEAEKLLEKVEKEYEASLKEKEEKIPLIIEKEERLKRAFKLRDEIKKINSEREKLVKEYKDLKKQIDGIEREIKALSDSIDIAKRQLGEKEKRINEIKVDSNKREKIFAAFEIQKEFERADKEKKEKEKRILELKELIGKQQKDIEKIDNLLKRKEKEIQEVDNNIKKLEMQKPPTNEDLLDLQKSLERKRVEILELKEKEKLKNEAENNLKEILKIKEEINNEIKEIEEKLKNKNNSLEEVKKDIEELVKNNMAGELAEGLKEGVPCPVCGSIHHVRLAQKVEEDLIKEKQEIKANLEKDIMDYQSKLFKLKGELSGIEVKEDMYKKEYDKLWDILKDINLLKLEEELNKMESDFIQWKEKLEKWNKSKEELETLIKKLKEEKASLDLEHTKLKEGINKDISLLKEFESSLEAISITYSELEGQLRISREELGISDFKEKVEEINQKEREIEELRNEIENFKNTIEELTNKKETLSNNLNALSIRKGQIEEIGKEKSKNLRERQQEFDSLSEGRDIEEYLKEIQYNKEKITKMESALKETLEKARKDKQNIESKKISALESRDLLNNMFREQSEKLENALLEKGFKDKKEALEYLLDSENIKKIEEEIKNFENEYVSVNKSIDRLMEILQGQKINEEEWNQLEESIKGLEQVLNEKRKEIGATEKAISDMQENLQKVEEFTKQKKELERVVDILNELDNLFQGNKFVDFIAARQLKYITFFASKRLKEISRGRYALEIDSDNNFVMRDDFNGGVRRSVDTLSGGETFLTSLSLALALSSHIQLKGRAPLEFFFLDEGFGSLDAELLDIVMTSLERLKKDKMVVGIISHVEELKNRVPVKLIVTPPAVSGEGSKVRIEYT